MPRGRPRRTREAPASTRPVRATRNSSTSIVPPTDDDIHDVSEAPEQSSAPQTPRDEDAEQALTPAPAEESDVQPPPSDKSSPPIIQPIPRRKRGPGRPPKIRPPDWDLPRPEDGPESTPVKRKRGRPPGGGFRGRPRGSMANQVTKVRVDKEGTMMDVVGDEVDLPEDPDGETKVDKMGNLLGGREYRVRTFTVLNRGKKLYMLSTEPARCCGFRDSYLFFAKHMQLHKVIVDEDEKRDLIDRDIIPHSYKGRSIGVVTARSVFREFGARIIVGGKRVMDDYYPQAALNNGAAEGEIADPNDRLPPEGQPYNKNQYVAWHGASAVYHTGGPSVPLANGKPIPSKRKVQITSANWQLEHARAASRYNSELVTERRKNWNGVYDPHTNIMHYPKITQPTHARWEQVFTADDDQLLKKMEKLNGVCEPQSSGKLFEPVSKVITNNFLVVDTVFVSPPQSGLGIPGPDGAHMDVGPNGLPDVTNDILDELPPECREAFLAAKENEQNWKDTFKGETEDGLRGRLQIGYLGFPV